MNKFNYMDKQYTIAIQLISIPYNNDLVPTAHIGRGESYLLLAKEALQQNFDGKAVDHVSLALDDLVK